MLRNRDIGLLGVDKLYHFAFDSSGTDTEQLTEEMEVVIADSTLGSGSVYLPPVSAMAGRIMTIVNKSGNTTTVYPFNDGGGHDDSTIMNGAAAATSQALAAAEAFTVLLSTGEKWIALQFDLTI
jgi:hypothetical protein